MPFWQDCLGCSGDCVGQGTPTYTIDDWFIGPGSRASFPTDPTYGAFDGYALSDVQVGDTFTVVGNPALFYTFDEGSAGFNGCGLPGCGDYPSSSISDYVTLPGSAGEIPASPWCPDGGVLVPNDGAAWVLQTGGNGMSFTVTGVDGDASSDSGFIFGLSMRDIFTSVFGTLGEITNGIAFITVHNERSGETYGVLTTYSCSCY